MREVIKLTRWQEFVPFTVPLTLLGGLMAYELANASLDIRLLLVLVANCLAMAYAFMINDIEDAEDDLHNPHRGARNAIAAGGITKQQGWMAAIAVAVASAVLYGLAGQWAFLNGIAILILAHLYSWKPVRLKALPVVDILSHILMLSALLLTAAYMVYDQSLGIVWLLVICMSLLSAYGQLYNQVRDFEADQAAGLHNTASLIGKQATQILSYAVVVIAIICLLLVIVEGAFPLWLGGVILVTLPVVFFVSRGRDMRGDETSDVVGNAQVQVLLVTNIVLITWLIYALLNPH